VGRQFSVVALTTFLSLVVQSGIATHAQAGCGDWLAHESVSIATAPRLGNSQTTTPNWPHAPCSGPHCHSVPFQPTIPAVPGIIRFADQAAMPACSAQEVLFAPPHFTADRARVRPEKGFPSTIDHPPRA
jgi:hypothetical protein